MAFTKITAAGIGSTETVTLDGLSVINNGSFGGNLTVSGVLTYEDVTNVDSVGLVTARNGIVVGSGITLSKDGDIFATGVTTATKFVGDGSELTGVASTENIRTNTNATFLQNVNVSGTVTATSYAGSGANLTGINADLVNDTSPQLGGHLDTNSKHITFGDSTNSTMNRLKFGAGEDLQILHDGSNSYITNAATGDASELYIRGTGNNIEIQAKNGETSAKFIPDGAVELYHDNTKQCETSANGLAFPSGKGIDFSAQTASSATGATTTVELLDHYEEGTWTPTVNVGTVASYITGTYTRIGRMVYLTIGLYQFSDTSSGSAIVISGAPFAATGTSIGNCWLRRTTTGNKNYNATIGESGASLISIQYDSDGNDMGGNLVYSNFAHSTPYMNISLAYQTT